ncbi:MAG: M14 family metallopeptidase [Clostridia bacterium]
MSKKLIDFTHYYTYQEIKDYIYQVKDDFSDLVDIDVAGKSWEERDIWVVTITNKSTGDPSEKPAIYVDGNIHAGEVTGAMVCLKVIDYLTKMYKKDAQVTSLVDNKTFYILPRVNPDGAEKYLTTPYSLRSSVRPYPENNISELPGLHPQDINDDGKILLMRVRDDEKGEWKISKKDSRIMLPRRPSEFEGEFYKIYQEGMIQEYDGKEFDYHKTPWGLDLNRNFPSNFDKDNISAGPYPTSEPEAKTIVDFILDHKNIGLLNCFHTTGGFFYRNPYTYQDEDMDPEDLRATKEIAREGYYATGYSDVKSNNRSTLTEWAYEHLGIIGYTTELWDRQERAGVSREKLHNCTTQEEIEEVELKLLEWNDRELSSKGFHNWTKFDHPQLGEIEIGGWDYKEAVQNPPKHLLDQECFKNMQWTLNQASSLPAAKIADIQVETIENNVFKITVKCENHGYLPTYITNKGKDIKAVNKDKLSLLYDKEQVEIISEKNEIEFDYLHGFMNGQERRYFSYGEPAKNSKHFSWVVKKNCENCSIKVNLKSIRGGSTTREINL